MKNKLIYRICRCGLFAAIICICSFISVPVFTVPITMALFGVMLCAVILSPLEALLSTAGYILIGAIGLPVFANFGGGFNVLFGATGGYIWSYLLLAVSTSLFSLIKVKRNKVKYIISLVGCIIGILTCYFFGSFQYMYVCDTSFITALAVCVVPYIPLDIIKAVAAVFIGHKIKDRIN